MIAVHPLFHLAAIFLGTPHHHHHTTTTVTDREAKKQTCTRIFSSRQQQTLDYTTKPKYVGNQISSSLVKTHASISFSSVFAPAAWEENEPAGKNNPNKAQFRRNHCLLIFPSQLRQQWQLNQSHFSRQVGPAPNIGPSAIVALLWMKRNLISVKKS